MFNGLNPCLLVDTTFITHVIQLCFKLAIIHKQNSNGRYSQICQFTQLLIIGQAVSLIQRVYSYSQRFKMNDFLIDIRDIADEDSVSTIIDVFVESAMDQKGVRLAFANQFFQSCLNNLENPSLTPKTKFFTVYMMRELSMRETIVRKIFGPFSRHPLYTHLQQLALKTDPRKPVEEKGKNIFPGDKKTGNDFMRLILQSLLVWGNRFGANKQKPTRFTTTIQSISDARVVIPKQFIYYQKKGDKNQTPGGGVQSKKQVSKKSTTQDAIPTPSAPKGKEPREKYAVQINYMFNKIDQLGGIFDDVDDVDELMKEVNSFHQKFQKDYDKLQAQQAQILDGQDSEILELCFKIIAFFEQQKQLFNLHARNNDYGTYISGYKIAFEKIFQMQTKRSVNKGPSSKIEPSIDAKVAAEQSYTTNKSNKANIPSSKTSMEPKQKVKREKQSQSNLSKKVTSKVYETEVPRENRFAQGPQKILNNFIEKFQKKSRSKSQMEGFGNVAKSLSKSKMSTVIARKRNPMAVSNFKQSRFGASSIGKSTVNLKGIFAAPPNPHIKARNYEGEFVEPSKENHLISQHVLNSQGHRRFKASHFKTKYILFDDDRIQIGFKTSQIYEKVDKFSAMLLYQLFFGNKTSSNITRLNVQFRGDKQSLIYLNPQIPEQMIFPSAQNKLEVLNIPKGVPFGHISMHLTYSFEGQTSHISAYLPNSILQMVTYYDLPAQKYASEWAQCVKILKTQNFKLSPSFPPKQLKNLIPNLSEKSSYQQFERSGSTTDYQLYTQVIIQESFEGILKINVRPDLTVVLQIGIYESEQNCLKNFRCYVQSLQMVLKSQLL